MEELSKTLQRLIHLKAENNVELLVFLDGCNDGSSQLLEKYPQVLWHVSHKNIGASPARRKLYNQARGEIIFGFDDDAHPLNANFIELTQRIFTKNQTIGVIAFEEIKGIFEKDPEAMEQHVPNEEFLCNSFVGCGFAIRREVYNKTDGFPDWMDIYGEEGAVSIQVIENGYDILYTSQISINHRVNKVNRKMGGSNVFRFQRQLCNMGLYYLVFYPIHLLPKKLIKLYWHNLKKYAFIDINYFSAYFGGLSSFIKKLPKALSSRKTVKKNTIEKLKRLPNPKYG